MGNSNSARTGSDNNSEVNFELDDSASGGSETASAQHPPILVLSRDAALLETARKAVPRGTRLADAPGLDQAAEKLPVLQPGVLLVDTASVADVQGMVTQLTQKTELKRFQRDRQMAAAKLTGIELQRKQTERDLENVRAVAEAAKQFQNLMDEAIRKLKTFTDPASLPPLAA